MVFTYSRKLGSFPPGSGPDSQYTLQDSAGLRCLSRALGTGQTHTSSLEAREGSHVGHAGVSTFADSAKGVLAPPTSKGGTTGSGRHGNSLQPSKKTTAQDLPRLSEKGLYDPVV